MEKRSEVRIMQYGFYAKSSEEPLIVQSSGDCFKQEWTWGKRSGVIIVMGRVRITLGPGSGDGNEGVGLRNISKTEQVGFGSDGRGRCERSGVGDDPYILGQARQVRSGGRCYLGLEPSAWLGGLDIWESAAVCRWSLQ